MADMFNNKPTKYHLNPNYSLKACRKGLECTSDVNKVRAFFFFFNFVQQRPTRMDAAVTLKKKNQTNVIRLTGDGKKYR